MNSLRIGLSTQTPLVRFLSPNPRNPSPTSAGTLVLQKLQEGHDYQLTPGGVTRMVLPSLREWHRAGGLREAHWFSLQPTGPRHLAYHDLPLTLHHLTLSPDELSAYARTKEKLWADIHGLPAPRFDHEDFRFYTRYNWFTCDAMLEQLPELDLAYVHDFQLMQMGALIGLAAPTVLRWHVPFDPQRMPRYTRNFLARSMEDFDAIIVSARRDLEGLLRVGYRGPAYQIYPHIDRSAWPDVSAAQLGAFEARWHLDADDPLLLCVARMDPMKRQDLALRALARVRRQHPRAHVMLVGNGSFSSSAGSGLGLSKSQTWGDELEALARDLRVDDRALFARYVDNEELAAAYARAQAVLLPSDIEGFGLTILEGWRYARPGIVSTGAGVSELVHDGVNGYVFPAGQEEDLADRIHRVLSDRDWPDRLSAASGDLLKSYDAPVAAQREAEAFDEAIARFGRE